jgi:hypothetical protein
MVDTGFKYCARCSVRHAPPTGKRKCKKNSDLNLSSLDDESVGSLVFEESASTQAPQKVPQRSTDDRIDTLVGVVSDLVSRVDSTQ